MHFSEECLAPSPSSQLPPVGLWVACGSGVRGFVVLGGEGRGSGVQSVKRHRNDRCQQVQAGCEARSCWAVERCAPSSTTVEDTLYGSVWNMISLLLVTDDVVL